MGVFGCYYQNCESKTCHGNRNHCYSGVDKNNAKSTSASREKEREMHVQKTV